MFRAAENLEESSRPVLFANASQKDCVQDFRHAIQLFNGGAQFLACEMIQDCFQNYYFFSFQLEIPLLKKFLRAFKLLLIIAGVAKESKERRLC